MGINVIMAIRLLVISLLSRYADIPVYKGGANE